MNAKFSSATLFQVGGHQIEPLMRIHSAEDKPSDAFSAVPCRGNWYWVEDRDFHSKFLFSFLMGGELRSGFSRIRTLRYLIKSHQCIDRLQKLLQNAYAIWWVMHRSAESHTE